MSPSSPDPLPSPPPGASQSSEPEKIVVRGVNWLGDAVMTTPALLRLREARPHAHITLLTQTKLAGLWAHHPALDAILTFDPQDNLLAIAKRLRTHHFSTALVLPNSPRSALEMFLARIPQRIGYQRPGRTFLLTHPIPPRPVEKRMHKRSRKEIIACLNSPHPRSTRHSEEPPSSSSSSSSSPSHQLFHYLHLVESLGGHPDPLPPQLEVTEEEVQTVRSRFGIKSATASSPLIGLNAGAEYGPAKRWPLERFVAAAKEVHHHTGSTFWVFGGASDISLAQQITAEINAALPSDPVVARCLAGQTSLRELCAALKACEVLLTNDTGPMHVAAAVGTPVVVPFGSTAPDLTAPGLPGDPRHRLLQSGVSCSPCFLRTCPIDFRCMNSISVDTVVNAVLRTIN